MPSKFYRNVISLSKTPADFPNPQLPGPHFVETAVVDIPTTTVVDDSTTTIGDEQTVTVVDEPVTTVVDRPRPTVVVEPNSTIQAEMWRAENGSLFPSSWVRSIVLAQDALTHAEESVYDFLWGLKSQSKDEYRTAQVGYDKIANSSRITKRNAALAIDRLIEKGFVFLQKDADTLHRSARQYRVAGYRAALHELDKRGRKWIVRSGNGVLFVYPVTIVVEPTTTVVADQSTTVVAATTVTVAVDPPTTVVAATTPFRHKKEQSKSQLLLSSLIVSTVSERVRKTITIDDDAVRQIVDSCIAQDLSATADEIGYFCEVKIAQQRQNPKVRIVGLLISSVWKFFEPGSGELAGYRAYQTQERAKLERSAREVLQDPEAGPEHQEWARKILA